MEGSLVPAEEGRLVFLTPKEPLGPGVQYTLTADGIRSASGMAVPRAEVQFRTGVEQAEGRGSGRDWMKSNAAAAAGGGTGAAERGAEIPCPCEPCPPANAPSMDCGAQAGDPVDCATGLFIHNKTDLTLPGRWALTLTRTYQSGNAKAWPFGRGATHEYDLWLYVPSYQEVYLILPNGGRIHFVRTSAGTSMDDAEFEHTETPTSFYKGLLTHSRFSGWNLRLKDGATYTFGENPAVLQGMTDRNGNGVGVYRAGHDSYGWYTGNIVMVQAAGGRSIQFGYDDANRIVTAQDNMGRKVNYEYDAGGNLVKPGVAGGGTEQYTATGAFSYDAMARPATPFRARRWARAPCRWRWRSRCARWRRPARSGRTQDHFTPNMNKH